MNTADAIKALRALAKEASTPRHAAISESRARMIESGGCALKHVASWLRDAERWRASKG